MDRVVPAATVQVGRGLSRRTKVREKVSVLILVTECNFLLRDDLHAVTPDKRDNARIHVKVHMWSRQSLDLLTSLFLTTCKFTVSRILAKVSVFTNAPAKSVETGKMDRAFCFDRIGGGESQDY
jgi:hypothetical protein